MPYPNPDTVNVNDLSPRVRAGVSRALPGVLFVLLVLSVYADVLFFKRNFAGRDHLVYNLPLEKVIHDAYARGSLPVWNPYISGGRPLLANPNSGALYPVRPLLALFPYPVAIRIFPILHWAAAGLGVLLLLRSLGASRAAAFLGAATYAFSGVAVSEVFFLHILPGLTLLPWIVWALSRPIAGMAPKVLLLSFLFVLDLLAADIFTVGLALLCGLVWILFSEQRAQRPRQLLVLGVSFSLALLAAAPQIVATALWIPETNRAVIGMKLEEVLLYSIAPQRLLELVIPYPFGHIWTLENALIWARDIFNGRPMGLFLTLHAGALSAIAIAETWKSRRPGVRFAQCLIALTILLGVLPSLVPKRFRGLPSPLALRSPEKVAVLLALALALLAGLAFDRLRAERRVPRWALGVGAALVLLMVAAFLWREPAGRIAAWVAGEEAVRAPGAALAVPEALAEAALLWLVTLAALFLLRSGSRPALGLCVLLLALVPIAVTRKIVRTFPEAEVFSPPTFVRYLRRQDPEGQYRTLGETIYETGVLNAEKIWIGTSTADPEFARRTWHKHSHALWGRGTVFNSDFDSGDFSRIESLRRVSVVAAGFRDAGSFFESLSLRWGIRFRDEVPRPGYHRIGGDLVHDWDESPGALPHLRLAAAWREEPEGLSALRAISKLAPGEIVLETGRASRGKARPGTVKVIENHPERLVLETDCPDPSWLFVLRGFWSYRDVRVDGEEAEVFPAQLAFSAVPLTAGRHRVVWRERMPGWSVSRAGPLLYVLAIGLLFARQRSRSGR